MSYYHLKVSKGRIIVKWYLFINYIIRKLPSDTYYHKQVAVILFLRFVGIFTTNYLIVYIGSLW